MDRRLFLQKAGSFAVGSAFAGSFLGCGSQLNIPCLGPAAAPVPVPGMTYIRASEIGCALDCSLENGRNKHTGGAATDDGPRINAAMASATESNPITLIIDGSALISGLFLPAGGYWSIAGLGCGTGFFIKTGTNNDGIHNGGPDAGVPSDPGPPAPARGGANVSLSNFTLNCNQGDGYNGDSTSGHYQGSSAADLWYFGINLMNLNNITIEKVVVVNSPAYNIRLSNVGNVVASGCVMLSFGGNTDGIHFDGPANDIVISNCNFTTGDDAIALNCPEGYGGDISRVSVSGCTFNSISLMRLYTTEGGAAKFTIDTVSVTNCSGTFSEGAFLIGYRPGSLPNSVASLSISNCTLTGPAVLAVTENFGAISLNAVTFIPSQTGGDWSPSEPNHVCGFLRQAPPGSVSYVGSSLSLQNCVIYRNSNTAAAAVILEKGSVVDNLVLEGFAVQDTGSYSPVQDLISIELGSIGQMVLNSVITSNIAKPLSPGGFSSIGLVSGAGVLATGWEFPDAVMANEVPYISANSGLPSIKVDGVVEPYSQS